MEGCILKLSTILLILTWELRNSRKRGTNRKKGEEFWKLFCLGGEQMNYLGDGRICLEDQRSRKTIQINYKINFIQCSCQIVSLHFKMTFHRLLQIYCTKQKVSWENFSRLSFSLNYSSVSWDITLLYSFI